MKAIAVVCAGLWLMAGVAGAETPLEKPGIIGADDRVPARTESGPWAAVGHVNVAGYNRMSKCTGTQIAPQVVLTAAHCLINFAKKSVYQPENIHFVAGVDRGKSAGHSVAACVAFPPGFDPAAGALVLPDLGRIQASDGFLVRDMALIVLAKPLPGGAVIPLAQTSAAPGDVVTHAAYPADRRMVLMLHEQCAIGSAQGEMLETNCDTMAASSGGPLLREEHGELRVAGIIVATDDGDSNVALGLSAWPGIKPEAVCNK